MPFPYKEIVLDNGLRVLSLEDPGSGVVAVQLWYHVGAKDEQAGRQGFAHMFEHMMFRGTDRLGPEDHFKYVRRTGGDCNAYTSFDQTVYIQELPANQLELALWLEAERMAFLRIDQASYDTERKVVEEERRLGLNRPYGTVPEKLLAELFPGQTYGWSPIGNIAHLRAAAVGELRDFWQRYYVPNNATLVVVGGIKHDDVQRLAKKYFGWMPREADPPRVAADAAGPFKSRTITIKDDNAPAPAVGMVWRTVPARRRRRRAAATARHHPRRRRVEPALPRIGRREANGGRRRGDASSRLENAGMFGAGAVMSPFSRSGPQVLEAIRRHVEKLRTEPVTEKELLKAKNQTLSAAGVARARRPRARRGPWARPPSSKDDPARVNQRVRPCPGRHRRRFAASRAEIPGARRGRQRHDRAKPARLADRPQAVGRGNVADHGEAGDGPAAEGESRAGPAGRFPAGPARRRASRPSPSRPIRGSRCRTA